jgi:hypothetical protein
MPGKDGEPEPMNSPDRKPQPGDTVVLPQMPPRLLDGLPPEDQEAISAAIGKPVVLTEYDEDGLAELEFTDAQGVIHYIYVDPTAIRSL